MKRSVDSNTVAHLWANQTQDEAYANSLSFRGPDLLSYSTVIARHVATKRGQAVLFSTQQYSVTTSGHQSMARFAANHLNRIFVPKITDRLADTFGAWLDEANAIAAKLERATKPIIYLDQLSELATEINRYANLFGVKVPRNLAKVLAISGKDEYLAVTKTQRASRDRQINRQRIEQQKKQAAALLKWRAFDSDYVSRIDRDFLRYNATTNRIETSQRVQIPVKLAKAMFGWLDTVAGQGGCENCDYEILNYHVRSVKADRIKIGCHVIYFDEINAIAKQLQWDGMVNFSPKAA